MVAYPATPFEVQSETARANGVYVVTVPTQVGYKNVNVGKVDLTASYGVTVKGVVGTG